MVNRVIASACQHTGIEQNDLLQTDLRSTRSKQIIVAILCKHGFSDLQTAEQIGLTRQRVQQIRNSFLIEIDEQYVNILYLETLPFTSFRNKIINCLSSSDRFDIKDAEIIAKLLYKCL